MVSEETWGATAKGRRTTIISEYLINPHTVPTHIQGPCPHQPHTTTKSCFTLTTEVPMNNIGTVEELESLS